MQRQRETNPSEHRRSGVADRCPPRASAAGGGREQTASCSTGAARPPERARQSARFVFAATSRRRYAPTPRAAPGFRGSTRPAQPVSPAGQRRHRRVLGDDRKVAPLASYANWTSALDDEPPGGGRSQRRPGARDAGERMPPAGTSACRALRSVASPTPYRAGAPGLLMQRSPTSRRSDDPLLAKWRGRVETGWTCLDASAVLCAALSARDCAGSGRPSVRRSLGEPLRLRVGRSGGSPLGRWHRWLARPCRRPISSGACVRMRVPSWPMKSSWVSLAGYSSVTPKSTIVPARRERRGGQGSLA